MADVLRLALVKNGCLSLIYKAILKQGPRLQCAQAHPPINLLNQLGLNGWVPADLIHGKGDGRCCGAARWVGGEAHTRGNCMQTDWLSLQPYPAAFPYLLGSLTGNQSSSVLSLLSHSTRGTKVHQDTGLLSAICPSRHPVEMLPRR
jgi:hypothetical protein